jgi:FkbM family methyltransferase
MIKLLKYKVFQAYSFLLKKILGKYVIGVIVKTDNYLIVAKHTDMSVSRELIKFGSYSEKEFDRIRNIVTNKSEVIIVGGHLGAIVLPLAKYVKNITVFEANPETFNLLQYSIKLNGFKNITAHNFAVGEKNSEIDFVKSEVFSGGAKRLPLTNKKMYLFDNPSILKVPVINLDSFPLTKDVVFDLMIMDIEGSEVFALQGSQNLLKKVNNLIIEFIPHHLDNVSGYSVREFCNLIKEHFLYFKLSTSSVTYKITEIEDVLSKMYSIPMADEGIHFFK